MVKDLQTLSGEVADLFSSVKDIKEKMTQGLLS